MCSGLYLGAGRAHACVMCNQPDTFFDFAVEFARRAAEEMNVQK